MSRHKIRCFAAWLLIVCLLGGQSGITVLADETAEGAVMRLAGTEGTVEVLSQNGKGLSIRENMKLYSGNQVETEAASYAYVSLDDTKAVKLDALSSVQVRKAGKKLELLLTSGNLFFNVTAPLASDEVLNIRTSTMVTGIRGTSGFFRILNGTDTEVSILDGTVSCQVYDPVDGDRKNIVIHPGQKVIFRVHGRDTAQERVEVITTDLTEEDIPGYVAVAIRDDVALQERIKQYLNLDVLWNSDQADEKRLQDERAAAAALAEINRQLAQRGNSKSVAPVFQNGSAGKDSGSGSSGGGGSNPGGGSESAGRQTVTRQMPITASELNELLKTSDVILNAGAEPHVLTLDAGVTVPAGGALTMGTGVPMAVNQGISLQVDGTLDTAGFVENNGTIYNTSVNSFYARSGMKNGSGGTIENTGRLLVTGDLENAGGMSNGNQLEVSGVLRNLGGTMELSGEVTGTIINTGTLNLSGSSSVSNGIAVAEEGKAVLQSGTVNGGVTVAQTGTFEMTGGSVKPGASGIGIESRGLLILKGGSVFGGSGAGGFCVKASGVLQLYDTQLRAKKAGQFLAENGEFLSFFYQGIENNIANFPTSSLDGEDYVMGAPSHTLLEALEGAQAGDTVTLFSDYDISTDVASGDLGFTVAEGTAANPVVLDLNGYVFTDSGKCNQIGREDGAAGVLKIVDSSGSGNGAGKGTLEFKDFSGGSVAGNSSLIIRQNSLLILEGLRITHSQSASLLAAEPANETESATGGAEIRKCEVRSNPLGSYGELLGFGNGGSLTVEESLIQNTGDLYILVLGKGAEATLTDSRLIKTGNGPVLTADAGSGEAADTTLVIEGGTLIEGKGAIDDSSVIERYYEVDGAGNIIAPVIEFLEGTVCQTGKGSVISDIKFAGESDAVLGVPEEITTVIKGKSEGLFIATQNAVLSGYVPEGYTVEQEGGYYYLRPAAAPAVLSLLPPEEEALPDAASPSDAEREKAEGGEEPEEPDGRKASPSNAAGKRGSGKRKIVQGTKQKEGADLPAEKNKPPVQPAVLPSGKDQTGSDDGQKGGGAE